MEKKDNLLRTKVHVYARVGSYRYILHKSFDLIVLKYLAPKKF